MPPLRSFDDVDGRERGQKKTDDLRAMTTLGPRTLGPINPYQEIPFHILFFAVFQSIILIYAGSN